MPSRFDVQELGRSVGAGRRQGFLVMGLDDTLAAGIRFLPFVKTRPLDANRDGVCDRWDLVDVRIAGEYLTGQRAMWSEGDWTGDGVFDQLDVVAALQTGEYSRDRGHATEN